MKRAASALTLVLGLLATTLAGALLARTVAANPVWALYLPFSPVTDKPIVSVQSPLNCTNYDSTNVLLNLTAIKPDTWFRIYDSNSVGIGHIEWIKYSLDGQDEYTINVSTTETSSASIVSFSIDLTEMSKGLHTVSVKAGGRTYYLPDKGNPFKVDSINLESDFKTIIFSVKQPMAIMPSTENEAFQIALTIASLGIVAAIGAGVSFLDRFSFD